MLDAIRHFLNDWWLAVTTPDRANGDGGTILGLAAFGLVVVLLSSLLGLWRLRHNPDDENTAIAEWQPQLLVQDWEPALYFPRPRRSTAGR